MSSKKQSLESKLEELEKENSTPEACSIEKAPEREENNIFSNLKGLKRPSACSIDNHQDISLHSDVYSLEEEIPDFGKNISVSQSEREKILDNLKEWKPSDTDENYVIYVTKNGPYEVKGDIPISDIAIKTNAAGQSIGFMDDKELKSASVVYLCRCGHSKNMPFCDQMHLKFDFDGTCTAENKPYLDAAQMYKGSEGVYLLDDKKLCAIVRFCDPDGSCWNLVKSKSTVDLAESEAAKCCSGRLTLIIDDSLIEPDYKKEIQALVDTERDVLGPLWVKGGIPVKTDEVDYEVRNRVTLCRCGRSYNKPFCDGMHLTCQKLTPAQKEEEE